MGKVDLEEQDGRSGVGSTAEVQIKMMRVVKVEVRRGTDFKVVSR